MNKYKIKCENCGHKETIETLGTLINAGNCGKCHHKLDIYVKVDGDAMRNMPPDEHKGISKQF